MRVAQLEARPVEIRTATVGERRRQECIRAVRHFHTEVRRVSSLGEWLQWRAALTVKRSPLHRPDRPTDRELQCCQNATAVNDVIRLTLISSLQ